MGMSRCYSLMKCLLIIFNIIFLCVGSAACGFAAWALWEGRASESAAGRAGLCALCAWGGALALGALLALGGALRGSAALLAAAFALLALAAVAEATAAWWGAAHQPQLRRALRDTLDHTVRHEYGRVPSRTHLLDVIQRELECCGAESPRDWQRSVWARGQQEGQGEAAGEGQAEGALDLSVGAAAAHYAVPASCCAPRSLCAVSGRVPAASRSAPGLHAAPCAPRVLGALGRLARAPLALGAALALSHALTLALTLALCLRVGPTHDYKA